MRIRRRHNIACTAGRGWNDRGDKLENDLKQQNNEMLNNWKKELAKVKGEDMNYYIMWYNSNNAPVIKKIDVTKEIGDDFKGILDENISAINDDNISQYEQLDGEIDTDYKIIKVDEVQRAESIMGEIGKVKTPTVQKDEAESIMGEIGKVKTPTERKDEIEQTKGLNFIARLGDFFGFGTIVRRTIMEDKFKFLAIFDKSVRLSKVKEDYHLYYIPKEFSCIIFHEDIIVKNEKDFENIFKYREKMVSFIQSKSSITDNIFSDSAQFMRAVINDYRKTRKVNMVYSDSNANKITTDRLIEYSNHHKLDIKRDSNDESKISFEDSNPWHVIHAMAEDYYKGEITGNDYESKVKKINN